MDPTAKEHPHPTLISPGTSKSLNKNGVLWPRTLPSVDLCASGKTDKGGEEKVQNATEVFSSL